MTVKKPSFFYRKPLQICKLYDIIVIVIDEGTPRGSLNKNLATFPKIIKVGFFAGEGRPRDTSSITMWLTIFL